MKAIALGAVAELNPTKPKGLQPEHLCSFVPMEAVDDYLGAITKPVEKQIGEVNQGYTYFANDDVLFAKITPCMENGKCAIARGLVNNVGFGSTEFHVVRAHEDVMPEWIYYFLRQENVRREAIRHMTGSAGQQRVPIAFLRDLLIPLPPLAEQQRIAGLLRRADRLRRLRRYALEVSAGYLQAVFVEMFGELTANPLGWTFNALGEVANIASGVTKGRDFKGKATITTPYLRVANVQDGFLDLSEIKMIEALPSDVEQLRLVHGDVVMTEGGDFDKLGRGAIWEGHVANCIHQNHIFRVRLNRDAVLPRYFVAFLLSPFAKQYFLRASKQTTNLATINMTQLKALPVPLPPMAVQQKFVAVAEQHQRLRRQQEEALRQAEHLFQALLRRAFAF
jgi:type I restriction enzyme S subunit